MPIHDELVSFNAFRPVGTITYFTIISQIQTVLTQVKKHGCNYF